MRREQSGSARRFACDAAFYFLIAIILVYTVFPFYWAVRSSFTPEQRAVQHAGRSTARAIRRSTTSARSSRAAIPAGAAQLDDRRRRGHDRCRWSIGSLAAYALGPLPLPRPHAGRST